jgi:hypothetical protein
MDSRVTDRAVVVERVQQERLLLDSAALQCGKHPRTQRHVAAKALALGCSCCCFPCHPGDVPRDGQIMPNRC